jgi:hypothetical protein
VLSLSAQKAKQSCRDSSTVTVIIETTENVALGVEEFGEKSGLKNRNAEDLVDVTIMKELENEGLFARLYGIPK